MNEHQTKGKLKDVAGKAQSSVGRATGDRDMEARGQARQGEGKVQKKLGDVKQGLKTLVRKP
jgi:uncharacterized protein YjbJ (UPF0337 family)